MSSANPLIGATGSELLSREVNTLATRDALRWTLTASDTTTSTVAADLAGVAYTFHKEFNETGVLFKGGAIVSSTVAGDRVEVGTYIPNLTGFKLGDVVLSQVGNNVWVGGVAISPAGNLEAGDYAIVMYWLRASGTGTLQSIAATDVSFSVREILG